MTEQPPPPGSDEAISDDPSPTILTAIRECKAEAEQAKRTRLQLTKFNIDTYLGKQDFSYKQPGQSAEFLPKAPLAVEQWSAFVKRALLQFGEWMSVDVPPEYPLKPQQVLALLHAYLNRLPDGFHKFTTFPLRMSDAMKVGLLESLIVFKVYGRTVPEREFYAERGVRYVTREMEGEDRTFPVVKDRLKRRERDAWRLCIDLVPTEDYYPDPTGRGLYEIHQVERDIHDVVDLAEQGIYDEEVVEHIKSDFAQAQKEYDRSRRTNQDIAGIPSFRKRVIIDEFWGDLLDVDGRVVHRNIVCAMANDKYLIRKPTPNPWWHGESPFVCAPLVRVPHSVWHKAIYDHASPLNVALNEIFNLMIDGGISSVWGIKQLRQEWLEDPRQVANGVPQGITLSVKAEMPSDVKVLEQVATGEVPPASIEMFSILDKTFDAAAYTNDLKLGMLPAKQVKATEVVEASQSHAITIDGICADLEHSLIAPTLRKAYLVLLQSLQDLSSQDVIDAIGLRAAMGLAQMSPAERFSRLARRPSFAVHGLSATLSRVRDFQKIMAMMQAVMGNPLLMQAFAKRFSADKALNTIFKMLNINPDDLEMTDDEKAMLQQNMQELAFFQQFTGQAKAQGGGGPMGQAAGPQVPAEINQVANPLSGMSGAT